MRWFNGMVEDVDTAVERLDDIGGPESHSNIPWGWSQVGNTPLKWYKQNTHAGGVRDPLVISLAKSPQPGCARGNPSHGENAGESGRGHPPFLLSRDRHHADDPRAHRHGGAQGFSNGVAQMPLHGASLAPTLSSADAKTARTVQYFEMLGHRGIWKDGWKAVVRHTPGDVLGR